MLIRHFNKKKTRNKNPHAMLASSFFPVPPPYSAFSSLKDLHPQH